MALTAPVYAGMFMAKAVEVILFRRSNLPRVAMSAFFCFGGGIRSSANVILISGVSRNLPQPPPEGPKNCDQFRFRSRSASLQERGLLIADRQKIVNRWHSEYSPS
jgi:hypothetical protein